MSSTARPDIFRFVPTDVTGKTHVTFLFFLLPGKSHFFCVNYPPLARDFACFGRKCCHRKNGTQATGGAEACQPVSALATHESYATHMSHHRNVPLNFKNSDHATPGRRFSGMVSAGHSRCGIGRAFGCTRLHGDSPVGLRHLGKHAAPTRRDVSRHWAS